MGRRVACDDGATDTIYVQNGQQTIVDYTSGTAATSPTYTYVYASYIDEPVLRVAHTGGGQRYYHRNQQYSITALTDSAGAIKERYAYDAYGNLSIYDGSGVVRTATTEVNRYCYTGREWDADLELYHYRARMHDSVCGRFLSRDPIGFTDTTSLVMFLGANPSGRIDPYGFEWQIVNLGSSKPFWGHPSYAHGAPFPDLSQIRPARPIFNPAGKHKGKICAASMIDDRPDLQDLLDDEADAVGDHVVHGVSSPEELAEFVKRNGCCTLYTFGHQGGNGSRGNPGGTVSYPPGRKKTVILPSSNNRVGYPSRLLGEMFSRCDECFLNILACGGDSYRHRATRQRIADETGCTVCGSKSSIIIGGSMPGGPNITVGTPSSGTRPMINGTTLSYKRDRWAPTCVAPRTSQDFWEIPDRRRN